MSRSIWPAILLLAWFPMAPLTAAGAPEITVSRNTVEIVNSTVDPVYGLVVGTPLFVTYVIANTGALPLTIASPVAADSMVNCVATVTTQPTAVIAANSSTTLTFRLTTTIATAWSFHVSFVTDDGNENPTTWTASGTSVAAPVAQILVKRGATTITDGATDTLVGFTQLVTEQVTYTITNVGSATLTTSATQVNATFPGCLGSPVSAPAASIAVGASSTLVVQIQPLQASYTCAVQFTCNDPSATTFNWTMTGTAAGSGPEIVVQRAGSVISNSSIDAASGGTAGSGTQLDYTVSNTGTANLTVNTPTLGGLVNCTAALVFGTVSPVISSGSTSFAVLVTPTSNANWSVDVSLVNNDANENPTAWTIRGTATSGGSGSGDSTTTGGGGCGAGGTVTGLILALALLGLRRRI